MDNKKVYMILQHWFPKLIQQDLPIRSLRAHYEEMVHWLSRGVPSAVSKQYLMVIAKDQYHENGLHNCAVLKNHTAEVDQTQLKIWSRVANMIQYYDRYKDEIGRNCSLKLQIYDVVFEEIYYLLQKLNYELLLIRGEEYHWLAVPNDQDNIDLFCCLFDRLFADQGWCIEHYQPNQDLWSI